MGSAYQKNVVLYRSKVFSARRRAKDIVSNYVNNVLKRVLRNMNVSVNTLRHSYVNYISTLGLSVGRRKRVAKKMGHGIKRNMEYMFLGGEKEK